MTTPIIQLGVANCQSYDGDKSAAAWVGRAELMKAQKRNVWFVSETTVAGRNILLAKLGSTWREVPLKAKTVAVLYDSAVFSRKTVRSRRFGKPPTPFGHGAVAVPLVHKATKKGVDMIALHIRPGSIANLSQKQADVRTAKELLGTWPTVMGGDFAQPHPQLADWKRVTPNVDTMDAKGNQSVDAAFTLGAFTATNGKVINPGRLSDHKWLSVDLAL